MPNLKIKDKAYKDKIILGNRNKAIQLSSRTRRNSCGIKFRVIRKLSTENAIKFMKWVFVRIVIQSIVPSSQKTWDSHSESFGFDIAYLLPNFFLLISILFSIYNSSYIALFLQESCNQSSSFLVSIFRSPRNASKHSTYVQFSRRIWLIFMFQKQSKFMFNKYLISLWIHFLISI